jgi:uncharacterized membrane protein YqjE
MADRSSSSDSSSATGSAGSEAPGLGEQLRRTRTALMTMIRAHIKLAKAEFAEIGGELKRAAALAGVALYVFLAASFMLILGSLLFLGEWLFGSIGWGVLQGSELLTGITVLCVLAIIGLGWARSFGSLAIALVIGLIVGGFLCINWSWATAHFLGEPALWFQLVLVVVVFGGVGAAFGSLTDRGSAVTMFVVMACLGVILRLALGTFAAASVTLAILAGMVVIGALGAALAPGVGREPKIYGLVIGAYFGIIVGLVGGGGPDGHVIVAMGVVTTLAFWPIVASFFVFRHGIDTAKLRERFVPDLTIETTKETIEWVRQQMPLGPKS